ncbi:MAG: cation:proton antiporter, partial [Ferruginibacter sp.]
MKRRWSTLFYIVIVAGLGFVIYWIAKQGSALQSPELTAQQLQNEKITGNTSSFQVFSVSFKHGLTDPLAVLLLQIIVIIACARFFGYLFKKIGQPAVIGEIVAGIILGPSILGLLFPQINFFLFPAASLGTLNFLSHIGLILFMFIIGMELDLKMIMKQAYGAVIMSHAGIIIPFTLGMGIAYFIYTEFAPAGISFLSFALFMGITMSITAFPVLARILKERGLIRTNLGITALTCAAADDLTAWCVLAAVIALVKSGSSVSAFFTMGLAVAYLVIMFTAIRPALQRLEELYNNREKKRPAIIALLFLLLIVSSYITSVIGI